MRTLISTIIISIVLFIIGFYTWGRFLEFILPAVGNVTYYATSFGTDFRNSLLFSLTLALIPLATILIWKLAPVINKQRKVLTVCVILLSMIALVWTRREIIKAQARNLRHITELVSSDPNIPTP